MARIPVLVFREILSSTPNMPMVRVHTDREETEMKLHAMIRELATQDSHDPWGDAMSTIFGICDVLYAAGEYIC